MKSPASVVATLVVITLSLGGAAVWWLWNYTARQPVGSPAIPREQLWSLPTFERRCSRQEECEPPLSCVLDERVHGRYRCLGSECNSDADCEVGAACRAMASEGTPVRLCIVKGVRKEGERCMQFPLKKHEGCDGELLCNRSFCGRRCRLGDPASCPADLTCLENGGLEPSCVPDCLHHGCPAGKRCFQLEENFSACGILGEGPDCEEQPCPSGEKCRKTLDDLSDTVYLRCYRPCDKTNQCPPGHFCARGTCVEECERGSDSCGPNRQCVYDLELQKGFCLGG